MQNSERSQANTCIESLIEFILQFIQKNKESILRGLREKNDEEQTDSEITQQLRDFNFAQFLISLSNEDADSETASDLQNCLAMLDFLRPLSKYLAKVIQTQCTAVELKETCCLLITYD